MKYLAFALLLISNFCIADHINDCLENLSDERRAKVEAAKGMSIEEMIELRRQYEMSISYDCWDSEYLGDDSCIEDYDPRLIEGYDAAGDVFFMACGGGDLTSN